MNTFPFNEVFGHLSIHDRNELRLISILCAYLPGQYAEVGCLEGLSTCCILSVMPDFKKLYCYDWFEDEKRVKFLNNIEKTGRVDDVELIKGDFKSDADFRRYAFVFIDHSHSVEDTQAAYYMFWPMLHSGGVLAFHDYGHPQWPETNQWLEEISRTHHVILETSILAFLKE